MNITDKSNFYWKYYKFQGPLYPWAPSLLFGILGVIAGLLTLLLPETFNKPLPDTVVDLEAWDPRAIARRQVFLCSNNILKCFIPKVI